MVSKIHVKMEKTPEEPVVEAPAKEEAEEVKCDQCNEKCETYWWVGGISKEIYCDECWDWYEDRHCRPDLRSAGHSSHCDICEAHDHVRSYIWRSENGKPHCKICSSPEMIRRQNRSWWR